MRQTILERIKTKGKLPVLPEILVKLQTLLKDPDVNIPDIARLIELEPTLAGTILKLSNSTYYKTGYQKVDSLLMAVNKLGIERVKRMVFSLEITKLFSKAPLIDTVQFWKHSLAVANFTQLLAAYTKHLKTVNDTAYLSGLMHDVGILVFCYIIPEEYSAFLKNLDARQKTLENQEKEAFGINHQELGALFIKRWWLMDKNIVNAVRYHHFPFTGTKKERQCQQLVHLANGICSATGQTNGINCYHDVFNNGAWENLGLSLKDVEKMMTDVKLSISQSMELLGYK